MRLHRFGCCMVVDDDAHVYGVFTSQDFLHRVVLQGLNPATVMLEDVATMQKVGGGRTSVSNRQQFVYSSKHCHMYATSLLISPPFPSNIPPSRASRFSSHSLPLPSTFRSQWSRTPPPSAI
jgi:hypothetical protein